MGQSQSVNRIDNRWELIESERNLTIVRDKSGREGEEYEIEVLPEDDPAQQFAIYNVRGAPPRQVVAVFGSQYRNQPGGCFVTPSFRVITQRLCIRFNYHFQLNQLQEVLYVLAQSVRGFAFLYSKVGCFSIAENMMGLTSEGELKVWMNQILGSNRPQFPKGSILTARTSKSLGANQQQNYMIRNIWTIIKRHTEKRIIQKYLGQYRFENYNFSNLFSILQGLKQAVAQRVDITKLNFNTYP